MNIPHCRAANGMLGQALSHHQAGRLAEAKRLYGETLAAAPDNVNALHLFGVIECQADNPRRAAGPWRSILTSPRLPEPT